MPDPDPAPLGDCETVRPPAEPYAELVDSISDRNLPMEEYVQNVLRENRALSLSELIGKYLRQDEEPGSDNAPPEDA